MVQGRLPRRAGSFGGLGFRVGFGGLGLRVRGLLRGFSKRGYPKDLAMQRDCEGLWVAFLKILQDTWEGRGFCLPYNPKLY